MSTDTLDDNSVLLSSQNICHNAILFHKMIEDIKPKINTCMFKLIEYLNRSIEIQTKQHKKELILIEQKTFINNILFDIVNIYDTLQHLVSIIEKTILSFKKIPPNVSIIFDNNLYYFIDYLEMYDVWNHTIHTKSLQLSSICRTIRHYNEELNSILTIDKKSYSFDFHHIKYEHKIIYTLQRYTEQLSDISDNCREFAIVSAAKYKDITHNVGDFNVRNYTKLTLEITRIHLMLNRDPTFNTLKQKIKKLNVILSILWEDYISAIKEQCKLQFLIKIFIKKIEKIETNNYTKCEQYKEKILVFTIVSQQVIEVDIDNILSMINVHIIKLSELTREYKKKNRPYTKIMKNYNNYIKIMIP